MSGPPAVEQPPIVFRLNENGLGPELLRQVFLERGWLEFDEDTQCDYDWNLWWRTSRFRTSDYDQIYPWQRLNHYPRSTLITKKDALARNLKRMRCVHGANVFNFSPLSFNLPNDYTKYVKAYSTLNQRGDAKAPFWICKPADLSRGRGIFIFRDLSELMYDCNAVVQHYIDNPLLIGGYKFDLRIYVAVTSFHPLTAYIHQEGIVRFSTEKFDLNSTKNVFAHLTNTSINKHSPGYTEDKELVGPGCKWTLTQLRHYFRNNNVNDQMLWRRIINIVILTLMVQAPQVQKVDNCFELYGFDILVDEAVKPWLLEVNFSPSLSSDCAADLQAKKPMLHDLLDLLHYRSDDGQRGGEQFRHYFTSFQAQNHAGMAKMSAKDKVAGVRAGTGWKRQCRHGLGSSKGDRARGRARGLPHTAAPNATLKHAGDDKPTLGSGGSDLEDSGKGGVKLSRQEAGDEVDVGRDHVRELLDSVADQAFVDWKSLAHTHYSPHNQKGDSQSKAAVLGDNQKCGQSDGGKTSKISADSGLGSDIKLASNFVGQLINSNCSDCLPEVFPNGRIGSAVKRRNSRYGDDISLHLPSLENSASSKSTRRSKMGVLTPRSCTNSVVDPAEDADRASFRPENQLQTSSKSVSTKSLLSINNDRCSQCRQQVEDSYPMTHRSMASMSGMSIQSSIIAGPRHAKPYYAKAQPTAKFMQPHPRQQKLHPLKSAPNSSFTSLKKRVGQFYLVFPFNESTHKAALTTLDARLVIRETQQIIHEKLNNVSNSRSSTDHEGKENDELWAPLKVSEENA